MLMAIAYLGCAGIGLVWGWLAGWIAWGRNGRRVWSVVGLLVFTASLSVQPLFYTGWLGALLFLALALVSFCIHQAWLARLRDQIYG